VNIDQIETRKGEARESHGCHIGLPGILEHRKNVELALSGNPIQQVIERVEKESQVVGMDVIISVRRRELLGHRGA
jgi:hypothetical protein